MSLINQPFDGQLGDILIEKLQEDYNRLTIVVAFAKNSGVLRLKPELERFRANGGTIHIFVGIDIQGTSYEALKNLLPLCDSLYVVHSEDGATTFHSKMFLLENDAKIWMAVGSNNLTGGGLWTNFESCQYQEHPIGIPECDDLLNPFSKLIARYTNADCEYSRRIENENDIQELENAGYLIREFRQRINQNEEKARRMQAGGAALFGRPKRAGLPRISAGEAEGRAVTVGRGESVHAVHAIVETNDNERIWFETRKLTGGSRNILDLSKLGTITNGTGAGSRYETDDSRYILGGVAFFDIDPEATAVVKNIIINYDGIDYSPCEIEFTSNNGSWRMHISGVSAIDGKKLHLLYGTGWLVNKILVFEKIRTDYYALFVLASCNLVDCKLASYVTARNGSSRDSKEYGLFSS